MAQHNVQTPPLVTPTGSYDDINDLCHHDVVIVGAGVSGLMAARELLQSSQPSTRSNNVRITMLEASDYIGGRIKGNTDFCPGHVIDMGAEFVHGTNTILSLAIKHYYKKTKKWQQRLSKNEALLEEIFITAHGDGGPSDHPTKDGKYGMYYVNKQLLLYNHAKLQELHDALFDIENLDSTQCKGKSVGDYLQTRLKTNKQEMWDLAKAGYANTVGCTDLNQLSLEALVGFEQYWSTHEDEGDTKLNSKIGMYGVIEALVEELKSYQNQISIKLNCPVSRIVQGGDDATVLVEATDKNNGRHFWNAGAVIVTVPPPALQDIQFYPPLSSRKQKALQHIGMDPCLKLFLKFSARVWPTNVQSVVAGDEQIPEMFFREIKNQHDTLYLVGCFLSSHYASNFVNKLKSSQDNMDPIDIAKKIVLRQMSEMFQLNNLFLETLCLGTFMFDWTNHPTVRGGYMYPKPGFKQKHLQFMAQSESNVHFAGEATHEGACSTVQAAMETGVRAAKQVLLQILQNEKWQQVEQGVFAE